MDTVRLLSKLVNMPPEKSPPRLPLSRDRVIRAAVRLADEIGLDALTMRRLGSELGVEAMSLYKHVANKEAILDGVVDAVIGEIELPEIDAEWRGAMRQRATSAREVLTRHSWAIGLMESRRVNGPATLRYMNAIIGNLRTAGFSVENSAHAFWLLDSFVYGHVIQEVSFSERDPAVKRAPSLEDNSMTNYPFLLQMYESAESSAYSLDTEFEAGLELILAALSPS